MACRRHSAPDSTGVRLWTSRIRIGIGASNPVGSVFTFTAFLGAAMHTPPSGWLGGLLCLLAIFTPSFLLVAGALPF
jgi:hypothetical protein